MEPVWKQFREDKLQGDSDNACYTFRGPLSFIVGWPSLGTHHKETGYDFKILVLNPGDEKKMTATLSCVLYGEHVRVGPLMEFTLTHPDVPALIGACTTWKIQWATQNSSGGIYISCTAVERDED